MIFYFLREDFNSFGLEQKPVIELLFSSISCGFKIAGINLTLK